MIDFERALLLLLLVAGLSVVGRWLPWPQLITFVLGGVGAAMLPGFPRLQLDPGFFFLCFLPPLLFSDGWLMPLRELAKAKRPVILLAIGLVTFTTVAVGLVAHWLVPGLPLAMAFALGAVVSPTDAVAVSAATEHLRVPARMTAILNGESLMNDATGLVAFKFALAALVLGGFSAERMVLDFGVLALGGLGAGLGAGYAVGRLRDLVRTLNASDALIETTLSLMTPYAAYLLAEHLGVSGVLSAVAAGLYSGWRDPIRMDAQARQSAYEVWSLVVFWLNGIAFVLLGLQFPAVYSAVRLLFTAPYLIGLAAAVAGVAIIARLVWVFPATYLPFLLPGVRAREKPAAAASVLVVGWAGMRGTVTLAAALSIPLAMPDGTPFPGRAMVIFLAFGVIVTTLALQGTTLEWLIRRLGIQEDESRTREEHLARVAAVESGLHALRQMEGEARSDDRGAALGHVIAEYEQRLAVLVGSGEGTATARRRHQADRAFRLRALEAERGALDGLWRSGTIIDDVHRPLQQLLDHEESLLRGPRTEPPARLSG
jgi:CPA1 family monovalent cation:H+ antiporter